MSFDPRQLANQRELGGIFRKIFGGMDQGKSTFSLMPLNISVKKYESSMTKDTLHYILHSRILSIQKGLFCLTSFQKIELK